MKLKQVLLGGLLFTVPFTACTNEELIDTTVPSTPEEILSKAVSLGDDFSIVANKGISTKAFLKDDLSGSVWEKTDTVGGAWYAWCDAKTERGDFINSDKELYSNHPFAFYKDLGGMASVQFKANTNAFAGKYLLYYPYNYKVAAKSAEIPIVFEQNPVMDCTAGNELKHVNKNLFAWCDAEFKLGGPQAGAFELKQVGNVVVINLGSTEGNLDRIQNKKIEKIILESGDGATSTTDLYNTAKIVADGSKKAYEDFVGKYEAYSPISTYILTPENAGTDYQITAADKAGMTKKPFYLSMLPANKNIAALTVKVIMSEGRMFQKVLTKEDNAELFAKLVASGKKVVLDVILDEEIDADGIYTVEQFSAAMTKASEEIKLAADITLPSLDFNKPNKSVIISGKSLTVSKGLTVTAGNLTVSSKLVAKDKVTVAENGNLTVGDNSSVIGALKVDGVAAVAASEVASVEVTKAAELALTGNVTEASTMEGALTVEGALTIGRSADVTLTGVVLKGTTTNSGGEINVAASSVNEGTFSSTSGSIAAPIETRTEAAQVTLTNKKAMTLNGTGVTGNGGIVNEAGATLNVSGDAATISAITNKEADDVNGKAAGVVNVELAANETKLTVTAMINDGVLNIKKGELNVANSTNPTTILGGQSATDVAKGGFLNIGALNNVGKVGARVVIAEVGGIRGTGGFAPLESESGKLVVVALAVADAGKIPDFKNVDYNRNAPITSVMLTAETTLGQADIDSLGDTQKVRDLILTKNIKITKKDEASSLNMGGALNVEGEVTISSDADTNIPLKLAEKSVNRIIGVLTVGKGVTLTGSTSDNKPTIKMPNGAGQWVAKETGEIKYTEFSTNYTE